MKVCQPCSTVESILERFMRHMSEIVHRGLYRKLLGLVLVVLPMINALDLSLSSSAVCFLTRSPSPEVTRFASQLARNISHIDVFILADDDNASLPLNTSSNVRLLRIDAALTIQNEFREANVFGTNKSCSAWDKAIYYFSKVATNYSFVWFIEEDVFIPSVQAFLSLHELYSPAHDLVTTELYYNTNGNINSWFHWPLAPGTFALPWARGMVCAMGCSGRLLSRVHEYVRWRGELTFIEFLFHTTAIHDSQMKIVLPLELSTIVYREKYTFEDISKRPNNWWHPVKTLTAHDEWRNWLAHNSSTIGKQTFVQFFALKQRMKSTAKTNATSKLSNQLNDLLEKLQIVKGYLDPSDRHRLRSDFLRLAENRSGSLAVQLAQLADHALKLSEPYFDPYSGKEKTMIHLALEEAIASKKEAIYRLKGNRRPSSNTLTSIIQLREETRQLMLDLTHEIKCEQRLVPCRRTGEWITYNYRMRQYLRRDSSKQQTVLVVFFLCFLLILYRVKRTKYWLRRKVLVDVHSDSAT